MTLIGVVAVFAYAPAYGARSKVFNRTTLLALCSILFVALGCSPDEDERYSSVTDSSGVEIVEYSYDLASPLAVDTIRPNSVVRLGHLSLGRVVDATVINDTLFAILDRLNQEGWIVGEGGNVHAHFGGAGDGPGELSSPVALEAVDDRILVWDLPSASFATYDRNGDFLFTATPEAPGDLTALTGRIDLELEDLPTRLSDFGSDAFILQIEQNERAMVASDARGRMPLERDGFLVVYDSLLAVQDSIVRFEATTRRAAQRGPSYGPPIFSPRPLWSADHDRFVLASSGEAEVALYSQAGHLEKIIRWEAPTKEISDRDRLAHVRSFFREQEPFLPTAQREHATDEWLKQQAREISMADQRPALGGIHLTAGCLWVSGFAPGDASDGTSNTWTIVDLANQRTVASIRFAGWHEELREVDISRVIAVNMDSLGRYSLHIYELREQWQSQCLL